jgi:hypothetical protein
LLTADKLYATENRYLYFNQISQSQAQQNVFKLVSQVTDMTMAKLGTLFQPYCSDLVGILSFIPGRFNNTPSTSEVLQQ